MEDFPQLRCTLPDFFDILVNTLYITPLGLEIKKTIAIEMYLESPDWEQILEMLPVEESEDMEDKRRFLFTIFKPSSTQHKIVDWPQHARFSPNVLFDF